MVEMMKDAMEYLVQLGEECEVVEDVFDTPDKKFMLVKKGQHEYDVQTFDKPEPNWSHAMNSLESFIAFLNSDHSGEEGGGCIFVSDDVVFADLNYQRNGTKQCRLPLDDSEEISALHALFEGVRQKELWMILSTQLVGCIPDQLLLTVNSLSVHISSVEELEIDRSGLVSGAANRSVKLMLPDNTKVEMEVDWSAQVRLWECVDTTYEIQLRMVLDKDDKGLKFTFHPVRLGDVYQQARKDLVERIGKDVSKFDVYDGRPS